MTWLAVAVAAGVGAVLRFLVDHGVQQRLQRRFPFGTWTVNVSGSFVLGVVVGAAQQHGATGSTWLDVVAPGLLGGYTTLSTWAWETVILADEHTTKAAATNALGSVLIALLAAAAGLGLGATF